jgi:hypothetical protein
VSISLSPAFLAARLAGTLDAVEAVVLAVEQAGSVAAAVEVVHPADAQDAIGSVSALLWVRRRLRAVRAAMLAIVTLLPERLSGVTASITALRAALGTEQVLVTLCCMVVRHLGALPTPLGFGHRASR